jgi:hypothetical protein
MHRVRLWVACLGKIWYTVGGSWNNYALYNNKKYNVGLTTLMNGLYYIVDHKPTSWRLTEVTVVYKTMINSGLPPHKCDYSSMHTYGYMKYPRTTASRETTVVYAATKNTLDHRLEWDYSGIRSYKKTTTLRPTAS